MRNIYLNDNSPLLRIASQARRLADQAEELNLLRIEKIRNNRNEKIPTQSEIEQAGYRLQRTFLTLIHVTTEYI